MSICGHVLFPLGCGWPYCSLIGHETQVSRWVSFSSELYVIIMLLWSPSVIGMYSVSLLLKPQRDARCLSIHLSVVMPFDCLWLCSNKAVVTAVFLKFRIIVLAFYGYLIDWNVNKIPKRLHNLELPYRELWVTTLIVKFVFLYFSENRRQCWGLQNSSDRIPRQRRIWFCLQVYQASKGSARQTRYMLEICEYTSKVTRMSVGFHISSINCHIQKAILCL